MSNFQPLEVVDRGSETQPQVVENLNKLSQQNNVKVSVTSVPDFIVLISLRRAEFQCRTDLMVST